MKSLVSLAALAAALACGTAQAQQITVKIGVMSDMSSLYADIGGPGSTAAAKLAVADFQKDNPNVKVEIAQRRPPEQARRRLQHRQQVVRYRRRRPRDRRAELRRRARDQRDRRDQEQGVRRLRRGGVRPHRPEVQCQHGALDLRHLDAGERHRQGAGQDRRRQLVLPHRRLCVRSCARARHRRGGRGERRQGARQGAPSAQHQRLLVLPAAGADLEGQDHRARQCGRRHHQLDQGRRRIRHRVRAGRSSPGSWCSRATSTRSGCRPRRA